MTPRRAIRTATISHNDDRVGGRVKLYLIREDGRYRWMSQFGEASEVTGKTVAEAVENCIHAWAGPAWDLRASWLR